MAAPPLASFLAVAMATTAATTTTTTKRRKRRRRKKKKKKTFAAAAEASWVPPHGRGLQSRSNETCAGGAVRYHYHC